MRSDDILIRRLKAKFIAATCLLAVLVFVAGVFAHSHFNFQDNFAAAINNAGKQRMMTVRLAALAGDFSRAQNTVDRNRLRKSLLTQADSLDTLHETLHQSQKAIADAISPELALYYDPSPQSAHEHAHMFIDAIRKLTDIPQGQLSLDEGTLRYILEHQESLIEAFDAETKAWQTLSEQKTSERNIFEVAMLIGLLLALLGIAGGVFFPTLRRLRHEMKALADLNETLEERVKIRTRSLEESENRFKGFATATADRFWETDEDHLYSFVSSPNANLNQSIDKMIGKAHWDIEGRIPINEDWDHLREAMDSHRPFRNFLFTRIKADGSKIYISLSGRPFIDDAWGFRGYRGSVTDLTDLKSREQSLKESEERFSTAFRASPALFTITTPEPNSGRFVDVSDSWLQAMGYSRDEVVGKTTDELNIWIDRKMRAKLIKRIESEGAIRNYDGAFRTRSGESRDLLISGDFIEIGGVRHLLFVAQDVTDQRRSEQALNQFKATLDKTHDCVFMFDPETLRYFYVNQGAKKQLGYTQKELLQMTPYDINPSLEDAGFREFIAPLIKGPRRSKRFETLHRRKDGTDVPVEIFLQYIKPKDDAPRFVSIVRDVSERKKAEYKIRVAYDELELRIVERTHQLAEEIEEHKRTEEDLENARLFAEKANSAKSEFLSSMSHELRTPLNAILGFAQLFQLVDGENLTTQQKDSVAQIIKGGYHLLDLVNDVLDLSKIESGTVDLSIENLSVEDALEECLNLAKPIAEQYGISRLDGDAKPSSVLIHGDRVRLKQVIMNLLSNAIKYNGRGGKVSLTSGASPLSAERLRISVSDTGPGIPDDMHEALFEPFNRVGAENSDIEGTGIGLSITRKLVSLMGGEIGFESEVGKGSTFWVDFSIAANTDDPSANSIEFPKEKQALFDLLREYHLSLLYVEDNPSNLQLMETIVGNFPDMTMISATCAEEGISIAKVYTPDVIVMDINLPGIDGYEAVKRLKRLKVTQNIPVIGLSANAMSSDIEKGLKAGFHDYLAKPIDVRKFIRSVENSLKLH